MGVGGECPRGEWVEEDHENIYMFDLVLKGKNFPGRLVGAVYPKL